MAEVLRAAGYDIVASDLHDHGYGWRGIDFLTWAGPAETAPFSIVTNPPFYAAEAFVRHALDLAQPVGSLVAMLLPQDFDCAPGRADIMEGRLTLKLSLRRRPRWDWKERARPKHPPRRHLAWYLWDTRRRGATRLEWGP